MKTKTIKEITEKIKQLRDESGLFYVKGETGMRTKNTYKYGQLLILKWVLGDSTIK